MKNWPKRELVSSVGTLDQMGRYISKSKWEPKVTYTSFKKKKAPKIPQIDYSSKYKKGYTRSSLAYDSAYNYE